MKKNGFIFHQDNARPHVSKETKKFMEAKKFELLEHPPYSPDLAPADFHLFPQLKKLLGGQRFETDQALETTVQGYLRVLSENGFFHVMKSWEKRCEKCILKEGDFVEK